jgi:hypothetical protein
MIVPTGDRLTFLVDSTTPGHDPYTVDMGANGGRGACTCEDWTCRRGPLIHMGKLLSSEGKDKTSCKHIDQVIRFLGESVVAAANGKQRHDIFTT